MMWLGVSCASWMIHSPRSVSTTWQPAASSASLRSVSSVAIDFDFTIVRAPMRCGDRRDVGVGLGARRPPSRPVRRWRVTLSANCSSSSGSRATTSALIARAARAQPVGIVERAERGSRDGSRTGRPLGRARRAAERSTSPRWCGRGAWCRRAVAGHGVACPSSAGGEHLRDVAGLDRRCPRARRGSAGA